MSLMNLSRLDTARSYIFEERADSKSSRWPPTEVKNKRGVHKKMRKVLKGKNFGSITFLLFIEDAERPQQSSRLNSPSQDLPGMVAVYWTRGSGDARRKRWTFYQP